MRSLEEFEVARGFRPGELAEFGVEVIDESHIRIPVLARDGHEWYSRTRCSGECCPKYSGPKGEELHLFNPLGLGPQSPEVWLAEGELDALSLIVVGAPALGILGTQAFNRYWSLLFEEAEIVIAFDSDRAGQESYERLKELWPASQVSRFDPSPHADINEWLVADREGLTEAVLGW